MTATPRIVLVRHGPSAYVHHRRSVDRAGALAWRDAYDVASIKPDNRPPHALTQLAATAKHIVASDLLRAIASAERIAPEREIVISPLLRETMLDVPRWPTRMPAVGWELLAHLGWGYRILRGKDTTMADGARATAAAEWLACMVADGSTAVVVTHGVFRRQLSGRLLARGWSTTGREGGWNNWSTWSFART